MIDSTVSLVVALHRVRPLCPPTHRRALRRSCPPRASFPLRLETKSLSFLEIHPIYPSREKYRETYIRIVCFRILCTLRSRRGLFEKKKKKEEEEDAANDEMLSLNNRSAECTSKN